MKFKYRALAWMATSFGFVFSAQSAFADWQRWLAEELAVDGNPAQAAFEPELLRTIERRQIVFVMGFGNELGSNKGSESVQGLVDAGVPRGRITLINPPSKNRVEQNASWLIQEFDRVFRASGRRPLVVTGYSKGGNEALMAVLRNPDLFAKRILDGLVVAQSPLGGTYLSLWAETLCSRGGWLVAPVPAIWFCASFGEGLDSLKPEKARSSFRALLSGISPELRERLSRHVWYMRSFIDPREGNPPLNKTGEWLSRYGTNDGIVLLRDQKLNGFGTDLGVIEAGHGDLLGGGKSESLKRAFSRALIRRYLTLQGR